MGNCLWQQRDTTDLLHSRALDRRQRAMYWAALEAGNGRGLPA